MVDLTATHRRPRRDRADQRCRDRDDRRGPAEHVRPGRNLLFLTYAAALAYRRGIRRIVGGMCETDFSGYPDCRDDTIKAMQLALNLGMNRRFVLETPLMWLDKAATWALAELLGGPSASSTSSSSARTPAISATAPTATTGATAAARVPPANCALPAGAVIARCAMRH